MLTRLAGDSGRHFSDCVKRHARVVANLFIGLDKKVVKPVTMKAKILVFAPLILAGCATDCYAQAKPNKPLLVVVEQPVQSAPALGPFSFAGLYDFKTKEIDAVVTWEAKSYGAVGKLSLDILGFGGSATGGNAVAGFAAAFSYPVNFKTLALHLGVGPAVIADKQGWHGGLFAGAQGSF